MIVNNDAVVSVESKCNKCLAKTYQSEQLWSILQPTWLLMSLSSLMIIILNSEQIKHSFQLDHSHIQYYANLLEINRKFHPPAVVLLTLLAWYWEQGIWNGRASVRPSVCPIIPRQPRPAANLLLIVVRAPSSSGAAAPGRSTALSSKCEQCHVHSWRRLNLI